MKEGYFTLKELLKIMEEQVDIKCVKFVDGDWIYISGTNDGKTITLEMEVKEDLSDGT